ncbi:MAG: ribose 5-phosphate isomerase B [Clostridia bacterium]|nr:ribose 5-phosphate isomerase B [Clostridia bacterium]
MKIAIAGDHGGFELKRTLKSYLVENGHEVQDFGACEFNAEDGFPDFALPLARAVANGDFDRGVLVCGSGVGVSIAANKVKGIRAVNCNSKELAELSRLHNNTNVICFGGRLMTAEQAIEYLDIWLNTEFLGGKYQTRNDVLDNL